MSGPYFRISLAMVLVTLRALGWAPSFAQGTPVAESVRAPKRAFSTHGLLDTQRKAPGQATLSACDNLGRGLVARATGTRLAELAHVFPTRLRWPLVTRHWGVPLVRARLASERLASPCSTLLTKPNTAPKAAYCGEPFEHERGLSEDSSLGRAEVVAHPQLKVLFGQPGDPLMGQVNFAPELSVRVRRGTVLSAQTIFPLLDEYPRAPELGGGGIRPGRVALSCLCRPRRQWISLADVGLFEEQRYGLSLEVLRVSRRGVCGWGGQTGLTGYLAYRDDGMWVYSEPTVFTATLMLQLRSVAKLLTLKAYVGRFLYEDWGARCEIARTFRSARVGFFAVRTTRGATGGFDLKISLPALSWTPTRRLTVRTPSSFPWTYRFHTLRCGYVLDPRHRLEDVVGGLHPAQPMSRARELEAACQTRTRRMALALQSAQAVGGFRKGE